MGAEMPLVGVTVVELGHSVAAPFAGQILGDLGARIVKIEKRGGDDARKWGPPWWQGAAAIFQSLNRNKLSVAIDLRDRAEREALRGFILAETDVVLQNMRPGGAEQQGLGAAELREAAPRLIYCNLGAFGAKGPLKDKPGYDPLMQAFGGLMSVTGEEGRLPVRVNTSIMDMGCGMWAVIGILSALLRRTTSGEGCTIDTSLYETALGWMTTHAATYQASGERPRRAGSGTTGIVPYRGYATQDGFLVVGAANDKLFGLFADALGHPEWPSDARFATNAERVKHQTELYHLIEAEMVRATTAEWTRRLEAAGVPCARLQTIDEVLAHPQTTALGMLPATPDGAMRLIGLPLSFDGVRPAIRSAPPALGADTATILAEAASG
jgi:crotonobetainyl-CoA:carnitine CoA-transferase CaiB-like acyl-CoA transferase